MKPGEWGEVDGKPAISWWRFGQAAKGEPSIVTEVRTYATEVERVDAALPPELGAKPTRLGEGFKLDSPASTYTKRATDRKMGSVHKPALEHVISYAYPSSQEAARHHHGQCGCFILKAPNFDQPFSSLEMASQAATKLGTVPGRWSFDHPSNLAFRKI